MTGIVGCVRFGVEYVMLSYWPVLVGILVLLFTLREIFQDLFHPSESGSPSQFVARRLFNFLRRYPTLLSDAGPSAVVVVILAWAILCVSALP